MKNKSIWFAVAGIMAIVFVLSSCRKDKDDPVPEEKTNSITYDGKIYPMSKAAALHWSKKTEGHEVVLVFITDGGQFHFSGNGLDSISGSGSGFALDLYSTDSLSYSQGTYTYDTTMNFQAGTFESASFVTNYNFSTDEGEEIPVYGGIVNVAKAGSTITVTYEGKDISGKTLSFYYKGQIPEYFNSKKSGFSIKNFKH
jgi:hypothetical protein